MLIKNGFEGIDFFANHPEMLPHVGGERNLFVGECVHLPEKIFENQAENFLNWYDEPTAKSFEGLSDKDWRAAKVYFDVRLMICRNYDKYADPKPQRLFYEISELYNKIVDETFKKYLDFEKMYRGVYYDMSYMHRIYAISELNYDLEQDAKKRWKNCSFCTYFQRPNLTAGSFQEIIPDEDKKAFEIFRQILEVIEPKRIFVLSQKASDSIKKFFGDKIPENIHFFNSEFPSQWSEADLQKFTKVVENFATKRAKYHLQNWTRVTGRKKFVEVKNVD